MSCTMVVTVNSMLIDNSYYTAVQASNWELLVVCEQPAMGDGSLCGKIEHYLKHVQIGYLKI